MMLVSCFALASCDDDESESSAIVGSWQALDYDDEPMLEYTFNYDGTGYEWEMSDPFSDRMEFTYSVNGSKLSINAEGETFDLGFKISDDGKSLVIYVYEENEELHLVRK